MGEANGKFSLKVSKCNEILLMNVRFLPIVNFFNVFSETNKLSVDFNDIQK